MIELLRFETPASMLSVDTEANVIRGVILAETGPFKTVGRGEFDSKSLKLGAALIKADPHGLKSRFGHPTESSDGLGKFLGRFRNPRVEKSANGEALRADMHLDPTAMTMAPLGGTPLGAYVMALAQSDARAFGTSLQLMVEKEYRTDTKGRPKLGENGVRLAPLWRPTALLSSDIVDTGDATSSFLAVDNGRARRLRIVRALEFSLTHP